MMNEGGNAIYMPRSSGLSLASGKKQKLTVLRRLKQSCILVSRLSSALMLCLN